MKGNGRKRKHKPHWYFQSWEECVLCGRTHYERTRRHDPRPEDYRDRVEYKQFACGIHFC